MTILEKIKRLQILEELSSKNRRILSPLWHKDVLMFREIKLKKKSF